MGVFRPGKGLAVVDQPKAIVETLVENAAHLSVSLQDQDAVGTGFPGPLGSGQTTRTAADDHHIIIVKLHPFTLPENKEEPSPRYVTFSGERPYSSTSIWAIFGRQYPP